jgi:hypothetical protein
MVQERQPHNITAVRTDIWTSHGFVVKCIMKFGSIKKYVNI